MQKKATGHSTLSLPTLTHTQNYTQKEQTHLARENGEKIS